MNYKELHTKYTPLISKLVRKYPDIYREDLEQEASIALFQAFISWDPARSSFITLAYRYISSACYKYMRDKAYAIRVPAKVYSDGFHIECSSLNELVSDNCTLEDLFGTESNENLLDLSITIWDILKRLADKQIISWTDFAFIYFRFFQQCEYKTVGNYFGKSEKYVCQRVQRIIQKIRPYFLGKKKI